MTVKDYLELVAYGVAILAGIGTALTALGGSIWWMSSLFHEVKSIRETSGAAITGIREELAGIHTAIKEEFAALRETLKEHDSKIDGLDKRVTKVEAKID